jgi:ferritin
MLINPELTNAINEQIGRKFGAKMQYLCIAAYFHPQMLALLA